MRTLADMVRHVAPEDLSDYLSDLSPLEWREMLKAAAMHRCIVCGEFDECNCPEKE